MQTVDLVGYLKQAMMLTLWLSLPPIAVAAVVGTLFSLFQALTQIQEQTLSFAVKLIAVIATLMLLGGWIGTELYNFTVVLFEQFGDIVR
ncbi:type III secretion protein HrpO [Robbsia andropogonis]|uniref:Type III secretion protein HrpO n=1 Tax=Robbsia andropogonis TaxID=28092 RepID=A0A0F5K509_9BURK|nr:type III secretion system export apparatus subunit SctS [Robbsia andropogonis]KKB65211.1 type III secretion protein HrpO [Robbsia andropogonis]MCP1117106.1 type III secretion system export apparatus subunit SctS [Robbsia andropogonis]MCP1128452.1 type III secretion system export apparatus subunit SctS [Robbsia andropogonis]